MAVDQSSTIAEPASDTINWQKLASARQLVAGSMALLNLEGEDWKRYDPSAEIDRKDCAMNLLLQAFETLSGMEEAHCGGLVEVRPLS